MALWNRAEAKVPRPRKERRPAVKASRAILKPYDGVNSTFWTRRSVGILAVLLGFVGLPYGFYYALLTPWELVPLMVPIVILLGIAIWALPDFEHVPVGALDRLLFVFFVGSIAWPNYLALQLPGLPWITASRLTGTPLVIIFCYCLSSSEKFRRDIAGILRYSSFAWKSLLAFVLTEFIALGFSEHVGVSMAKITINITDQAAMFFISCYVFSRPGLATVLCNLIWGLALFVGTIGLVEYSQQHVLWAGHIPSFLAIQDVNVLRVLAGTVRGSTGAYRTVSVFSTGLGLAEYMAWTVPFALHLLATPRNPMALRIGAAASLPFILAVILATDARLGLLGYFFALMLYLLYWAVLQMRRGQSLFAPAIILGYPSILIVFIAASFFVHRIKEKVWGTGQYDDSTASRGEQMTMAIPHVISNPLGHGAGNAAGIVNWTTPGGFVSLDDYYITLMVDEGVIGLVSYVAFFIAFAVKAARSNARYKGDDPEISLLIPLSICFVVFLIIKAVFNQDDSNSVMFMLAGAAAALIARAQKDQETETPPRSARRVASAV